MLDSSAVLAILQLESEAEQFAQAIAAAPTRLLSAGTYLELGILVEARRGAAGVSTLQEFLLRARVEIVAFEAEQAEIAGDAFRRYGRGRHAAGLNFGDCFAYALAKFSGENLLFKGNDFALTDVTPA